MSMFPSVAKPLEMGEPSKSTDTSVIRWPIGCSVFPPGMPVSQSQGCLFHCAFPSSRVGLASGSACCAALGGRNE